MKYSIRKQMTFAFVGLMAFVFFSNLLINNFFLEKYYVLRKKTVLVQAFREMNQVEGEEGFLDEEFLNRTNEICDANSTSLVILDHTFNQIVGTYDSDEMQARLWGYLMDIDSTELLQSKVKVLDEERHYTIQRNTNLKMAGRIWKSGVHLTTGVSS